MTESTPESALVEHVLDFVHEPPGLRLVEIRTSDKTECAKSNNSESVLPSSLTLLPKKLCHDGFAECLRRLKHFRGG
jgi:hypothetical protein